MIADCIEAKGPPPIFKYALSEFVIEIHMFDESSLEETGEKTREKILKFISENNKVTVAELAALGYIIWDRRTALNPIHAKTQILEERVRKLETVSKEQAKKDPAFAEILRAAGLL